MIVVEPADEDSVIDREAGDAGRVEAETAFFEVADTLGGVRSLQPGEGGPNRSGAGPTAARYPTCLYTKGDSPATPAPALG